MENIENSIERLRVAKAHFNELLTKKTGLESEANRLEGLLNATQAEVDACIKERRDFIEGGGDVFDPRAKKLRKQEQENAALIDDLVFAIETNRKAAESMIFDLTDAHNEATNAKRAYVASMVSQLIAQALANPPVELLKACHFMAVSALEDPAGFDVHVLRVHSDPNYRNMFIKKIGELLMNELSVFVDIDANREHISEEEKALLSVPAFKEKLTPAKVHVIRAAHDKKPSPGRYDGIQPWSTLESRQQNIVES